MFWRLPSHTSTKNLGPPPPGLPRIKSTLTSIGVNSSNRRYIVTAHSSLIILNMYDTLKWRKKEKLTDKIFSFIPFQTRELANEIINSGLRTAYPQTAPGTPAPPTTPSPNRSAPPGARILAPFGGASRMRTNGFQRTDGLLSNIFFFVRPVGPRPTRTPVASL